MPKTTHHEETLQLNDEGFEEHQLPTDAEVDRVWYEAIFLGLAGFLPHNSEVDGGKPGLLGETERYRMVDLIRAEHEAGQAEAVRVVKTYEYMMLLQLKVAGSESQKARAKGKNEFYARPNFKKIQAQLKNDPEWKKYSAEFSEAFQHWAALHGIKTVDAYIPQSEPNTALSATLFPFYTSQEIYALSCAQADGKTFTGYQRNEQASAIIHQRAKTHLIRMELTAEERAAGLALDYLESLARAQDADAIIATAYILGVLAPPPHLPPRPYAGGWIDFDDVLEKIGWTARNTQDRHEKHRAIWNFIQFGERAQIIGKRTGGYKDDDGNLIDTTIRAAPWRVMKTEKPNQGGLYPVLETPVRAEIVVSKELTALISHPKIAQYFQCGEVLGAIPGGKPAGAWARVIGLALMDFWRRNSREHTAGIRKPTRGELLNYLAAKVAAYEEILKSDKPGRAIEYWCGALQILADDEFIERSGEAAISAKEMRASLPRQDWQDIWLNQAVSIEPGAKTKPVFEKVLQMRPPLKPRDLKKKPRAKKRQKN